MTKKTSKDDGSGVTATFTFSEERKHSWLYREDGDSPIFRSVYLSKERFPQKPGNQIVVLVKAI